MTDGPQITAESAKEVAQHTLMLEAMNETTMVLGSLEFRHAVRWGIKKTMTQFEGHSDSFEKFDRDGLSIQLILRRIIVEVAREAAGMGCSIEDMVEAPNTERKKSGHAGNSLVNGTSNATGACILSQLKKRSNQISKIFDDVPDQIIKSAVHWFEVAIGLERKLIMRKVAPPSSIRMPVQVKTPLPMRAPIPWRADSLPLRFNENRKFFGCSEVHPDSFRNALVIGETGSGKTQSAILPYLGAALRYQLKDGRCAAVLAVDPKFEFRDVIVNELHKSGQSQRLVVIGEAAPIMFFPEGCALSLADRRSKIDALLQMNFGRGDHAYWHENSMAKLYGLLALQEQSLQIKGGRRLFDLWSEVLGMPESMSTNSWVKLNEILPFICKSGYRGLKDAVRKLHSVCETCDITNAESSLLDMYVSGDDTFMQFFYICTCASPYLHALADPELQKYVNLDPVPDLTVPSTDIQSLVEGGHVILIQPENKTSSKIAGKAIKAKVYEATFSRGDFERPVFTIVDEFQRFVTNDAETGEQSYLDRCRGYRGMAMFATQTLASLKYELGSDAAAITAVDIIMANTPTKLIMRSTDETTVNWLRQVIPPSPEDGPHVIDVHRPIGLKPGQAYFIRADGTWSLRQARLT